MTDAEIREAMKRIYETTQYSAIGKLAERQLAAITAGNFEAFVDAANNFTAAC